MKYLRFVASNLKRNKTRLLFTFLSIMTAFLLFGLLSALKIAFGAGADIAGKDRLLTVEPEKHIQIYPELKLLEGSLDDWVSNRQGLLVSKSLADRFAEEWKVGDRIPIQTSIWRKKDGTNTYDFDFVGIYQLGEDVDDGGMYMHYKYFDESRAFGEGSVGWYVLKIANPDDSAQIAKEVDKLFENSSAETKTSTEEAFAKSFAGQIGDMGKIISAVVSAVFFTMLLVVANTMSQSIRERTSEIGVLKTLGFSDSKVMWMVILESLFITLVSAIIGLLIAKLFVDNADSVRKYFPIFYIQQKDLIFGLIIAVIMGLIAGALPALQALKLKINDAMRKVA